MKKTLGYVAIALAAVVITVVIFRYYTGLTAPTKVPKSATTVLQINLRQLEKNLLLDLLSHPLKYRRQKRKRSDSLKRKYKSLTQGVSIPKAMYFYRMPNYPGWHSVPLTLSNRQTFESFLNKEGLLASVYEEVSIFSMNQIHFYLRENELVIGVSEQPIQEQRHTLFTATQYMASDNETLVNLVNSSADLTLGLSSGELITGTFEKGRFVLDGTLGPSFDGLLTTTHAHAPGDIVGLDFKLNTEASVVPTWLSDNLNERFEKFTHLAVDSIAPALNGSLSMRLTAVKTVQDTIVTYAYDDNFNKVETMSFQQSTRPDARLALGLEKQARLYDYFVQQEAIQLVESRPVFTPIPVYSLRPEEVNDQFVLTTGEVAEAAEFEVIKFAFKFRPAAYLEQPLEIPLSAAVKRFFAMTASIEMMVDNKNQLSGAIVFLNPYRNFLAQLIRP